MQIHLARRSPRRRAWWIDLALFSSLGLLVVAPWTRRGWLLLLDWVSGPTSTLTNSAYGLDSDQADAMPVRIVLALARWILGAGVVAWLPILIFFPLAGMGVCRLVGGSRWRRWAAGLAFTVNPFVFERLRAGHVLVLLGMALLPWIVTSAMHARAEHRWFRVRTAGLLAVAVGITPHLWWIGLFAIVATIVVPRPTRVDIVRVVLTAGAAAVTTAYGLVIQVVGVRTVSVGAQDLAAFSTRGDGVSVLVHTATMEGFWRGGRTPSEQLGPWWPLVVASAVAVAILGVQRARRTRPGLAGAAGVMWVMGVFLGAGASGPTGWLYRFLFDHAPMFAVMREAQKFVMLTALAWAVFFGFGVESLVARARASRRAGAAPHSFRRLAPLALLLPLLSAPTLLWGLGGEVQVSQYPAAWANADAIMGSGDEAVLMLPWHQYQPYSFTDGRTVHTPGAAFFSRPVISSDAVELPGLRSSSLSPRASYLDRLFARSADIRHLGRFLAALDVRYVVATTDGSGAEIAQWLSTQRDLTAVLREEGLVVFENTVRGTGRTASQRTVRSFDEYVQLVETRRAGAEAVFVDPTAAESDAAPDTAIDAAALQRTSPVSFDLSPGAAGWAIVPASSANGWGASGDRGRTTVQGVMAFAATSSGETITYRPWYQVRWGYIVSVVALLALFLVGLVEHRRELASSQFVRRIRAIAHGGWRRFLSGTGPAYLTVWAVATIAVNQWFRAGTFVSTGDMGPFIRRGWQEGFSWSWTHAITGAGSAGYVLARWYEFGLMRVVHTLGGTDTLAQRLFYMTIYPMVALAVASCAAALTRNRIAIAVAGSFAVLNGFFLTRLPNPLNVISVGCVAAVAAVGFRVAQGRRLPAPALGLAMLFMSFLAYNPPMLTVALAWTALGVPLLSVMIWGRKAVGRIIRYAFIAAPWALAINLFWLIPFAQAFTGGGGASATAQTDPTAWAWSQAQNNVPNVLTLSANWAWYKPQYLPFTAALDQPYWIWLRYLLPVLLFVTPLLALSHRRRKSLTLLSLVMVFTVLAKGLQPPFTQLNMFLYNYVPGFWLFREPMSKLGQLLVLFDALLLALAVEGVAVRSRAWLPHLRTAARVPVAFAVAGVLLWPYPLVSGAVIPDERPLQPPAHVQVPSYWRSTASFIDKDPAAGKVLVLPLDDYYQMPTIWGFSGVDSIAGLLLQHPVLQRHPDGYFGDTPGMAAQIDGVERALVTGDLDAVQPLLNSIGVRWIILRHDLIVGNPLRTFVDPATLAAPLGAVSTLDQVQQGVLDVYRVTSGVADSVRTHTAPLEVPGEPDAIADAVASIDDGQSVVGVADDYTMLAADTAANAEARSAADGVWWPVPAVQSGAPTTTFDSTGGEFSVHQRSRADVSMVATEVSTSGGPALELRDPTEVLIDGETVSSRPATRHPLTRGGLAVVATGDHVVSLDGWMSPSLAAGSSAADGVLTLPIGAATTVTGWAPSAVQPTLQPAVPVYDCNNYEPRPQSELRLSMQQFDEGGRQVTRLSAADHAACTAHTIAGVSGGDTIRLRGEYRTVEGKRPQLCLLEVRRDGSNSCVFDERLRDTKDWQRYELLRTVPDDVVEVRVVLYANVGLRLNPTTTSDYRGIDVTSLDEVLSTTVWPAPAAVRTVDLSPGTHTMSLRGGSYGSQLMPFEQLEDCFRYDDATFEEAGLAATVADDTREYVIDGERTFAKGETIELRAKDHMACIASTMPDYGAAGLYRLEYGYRSVALRKPRIAVYHRGPNVAEPLPANGFETEWSTYRADLQPTLSSVETRLYLYAPRDLAGEAQSVVQYRDVAVTPMASSSTVTLLRVEPHVESPTLTEWTRTTPGSFRASVVGDGVVSVTETNAPGWTISNLPDGVTAIKVRLNGWQNGWILSGVDREAVDLKMKYAPVFVSRQAIKISLLSIALLPAWLFAAPKVNRWRDRRRQLRSERRALRSSGRFSLRRRSAR